MVKMTIFYTFGLGLEIKEYRFFSNKIMIENADSILKTLRNRSITVLGFTSNASIEKVVYTYASGKTFTTCK